MIKPMLQTRRKLLFLYLLRSSSALATSEPHLAKTTSLSKGLVHPLPGHIQLRVATRNDVNSIQRCNLATLPENYSSNFYVNHLRQWPDLALVAEHVVPSSEKRQHALEAYNPSVGRSEVIGYVLGKVEETSVTVLTPGTAPSQSEPTYYNNPNSFPPSSITTTERRTELLGHVTSLAVLPHYRRRGLAAKLMEHLHYHMQACHAADAVGLHVRVSNMAARKLYCEGMGYGVVEVIRGYYHDEDAFFMKKKFVKDDVRDEDQRREDNQRGTSSSQGGRGSRTLSRFNLSRMRNRSNVGQSNSRVWENGPEEFRLPLIIPLNDDDHDASIDITTGTIVNDSPEEETHIMTGSL